MERAVLVVNPISGSARRRDAVARYVVAAAQQGMDVAVHATTGPGDGIDAARDAARAGVRLVIAAGGDGTVNDVAAGLIAADTGAALAILPLGTSNLVARHLGVPLRAAERAAAGIVEAEPISIDVGVVGERTFVACAGVGIDASIVADLSARRRGHIGFLSYAAPMWRTLRSYEMPTLTVTDDAGRTFGGSQVLVLNMRPYAAFLEPAPLASAMDGLFDVVVLRGKGVRRLLRWSLRAMRSRLLQDADATHVRCTRLRIESSVPAPVQVDGDVGGTTPVDMLVRPRALRIALPTTRNERRAP